MNLIHHRVKIFPLVVYDESVKTMLKLERHNKLKPIQVITILALLKQSLDQKISSDDQQGHSGWGTRVCTLENLKLSLFEMGFFPGDVEQMNADFQDLIFELLATGAIDLKNKVCSISPESEQGKQLITLVNTHPLSKFFRDLHTTINKLQPQI